MKPTSKIPFLIIILLIFTVISYGQKDTVTGKQVLTAVQIDSICKSIDDSKSLVEGIAEGGFVNKKGGWETYDLKSKDGDTLFRIRHNSSTDFYRKTTFYFFDKQLVKSSMEIEKRNSANKMKPVYSVTYYFSNSKPFKVIHENTKHSTASEMIRQGLSYQDNFYHNK